MEAIVKREPGVYAVRLRLFYGERDVSRLWIFDLQVRIGSAVVRMGGIGGVHTEEPYRMRGFARRVMEESIAYMREAGYEISALFGIPHFYERWGFVPALPEYRIYTRASAISEVNPRHRVVPYEEHYKKHVVEIYNVNNSLRTCSVVREEERWKGFTKGTDFDVGADVKLVLQEDGSPCGYVSFDATDERTAVSEVGYAEPGVFETIAWLIAQRAKEKGHEEIYLMMPPDHPFALYLRRFGCTVTEHFPRSGGGMMRIIDIKGLFAKIAPELSRRLQTSPFQGRFSIVTEIGDVNLEVDSGHVHIDPRSNGAGKARLEIPQGKLIQLLVGYTDITAMISERDVFVTPELFPLLQALFPSGYPYIWWCDRF